MTRQANRLQDGLIVENGNITLSTNGFITAPVGHNTVIKADSNSWTFGTDGSTTFPNDTILGTGSDPNVYIQTLANGSTSTWTFGTDSQLTLPKGGIISETTSTVEIAPPSANPGQSLMIRPTASFNLSASGYIVPGQNLIITLTNTNNASLDNTYVNYTITGATAQQLGLASLTGHFPYLSPAATNPQSASIVLPIPLSSSATTFTLTTDSDQPAGSANITITVTNNGIVNNEVSHVHLVAGDPTTVDLYLGDDDQYVKIEKDGGNVVIGTSTNTNHWTFGTDGDLTLPGQLLFPEGTTFYNNGISISSGTQYGTSVQGNTAGINQYWFADGTMPTRKWAAVRVNSTENASTGSVVVSTGAFNSRNNWIFAHDGSTVLPENTLKGYCFTTTNTVFNYLPQSAQFMYTDNPILQSIATIGGAWYIKGPGLVGWKPITAVQDNGGVALIVRIGSGNTPLPDGSEFNSGGHNPTSPDLVYTISQYLELDVKAADKTWTFNQAGSVTFPDNTVQTTAYIDNTPPALAGLLSTATTIAITAATAQGGPSANVDVTITNHQVDHYGSTAYTGNVLSTGLVVIPDTTQSPPIAHTILQVGSQSLTQSYSLGASGSPAYSHYIAYAYVVTAFGTVWSAPTSGQFGSVCLIAGTMILLSDGTRKAIEDITYTDKLQSWNFDQGCYAETTALWIKQAETGYQYNLLTFSDGTTLRTFDQHRIFNKEAGAFTYPMTDATPIGTTTVNEHGQEITLVDKQVIQDTIEYYNVITDYHMNLFSDTILTSCRFNNIYPVTDMKFVKDGRTSRTRDEFANIPDRFFYGLRLAEQTTDIETVEWYVTRLLALEESFEAVAV